jgi:hypothetical protein
MSVLTRLSCAPRSEPDSTPSPSHSSGYATSELLRFSSTLINASGSTVSDDQGDETRPNIRRTAAGRAGHRPLFRSPRSARAPANERVGCPDRILALRRVVA